MFKNGVAESHKDLLNIVRQALNGYGDITLPVTYVGTGDGLLIKPASPPPGVSEVWTMVCTLGGGHGVATFSVTGSVSGAQAAATVGTFYDNGLFEFAIIDGAADFVISDQFDVTVTQNALIPLTQEWAVNRFHSGVETETGSTLDFPNNAISGNASSECGKVAVTTGTLQLNLDDATDFDSYYVRSNNVLAEQDDAPADWTVEYSDDAVNWTVADTRASQVFTPFEVKTFALTEDRHLHWRFVITDVNGGVNINFGEFNMHKTGTEAHILGLEYEGWILQGQGLAGADEIYIGAKISENILSPYFNWRIQGLTAYDSGLTFYDQPGVSPQSRFVLNDATMEYWIFATGRYVHLVTKQTTDYTDCHMGLILPYGVPSEYPYPLAIMGGSSAARHYTSTDIRHRQSFDPGEDACWLREPGGTWKQFENYTSTQVSINNIFPFGPGGQGWSTYRRYFADSPDGVYEMYPLIFLESESGFSDPAGNAFGEIEDCFMVSGSNNSAENTITVGGDTYIVFQNVFRTTFSDFYAIKVTP